MLTLPFGDDSKTITHSPEPWDLDESEDCLSIYAYDSTETPIILAEFHRKTGQTNEEWLRVRADARMMASALALRHALRGLVYWLDFSDDVPPEEWETAWKEAYAALALADGKETHG